MTHDIPRTADYRDSIRSLKQKVQSAQIKTARAVNTRLMGLYRDLGKLIAEKQRAAGRGDAVIEQIDHDLTRELGGVNGFSQRNLYRIKQWYSFYADQDEYVPQLVAHIPWDHNALIVEKIKDQGIALRYVRKTLENNWSRNVLAHQIDTRRFERRGAKTGIDSFSERLPIPDSDLARESLKDPYVFDFPGVGEEAGGRALKGALTEHPTRFMLEFGKGFAFVWMQTKIKANSP